MKKVYWDTTGDASCFAVFAPDAEVISAGASISSMSVKEKNSEYQRYADEFDIHFIFDDDIPSPDFYTIPRVDIFAYDSGGGYIGSIGQPADLESDAPVCYIDRNKNCFLIADSGKEFLENADQWKNLLTPYTDIEFFSSKEEAENKYEFLEYPLREQN